MYIHIVPLISGDVYIHRFTCYAQCNDCIIECNNMAAENFICYFRVSTKRQGQSGLGLEAQRKSVNDFLAHRDANIIHEFTEVESGRRNNRVQLLEAIELCKSTDSTLLVANISRLTRNAAFLLNLRDSGVKFIAADMPDANNLKRYSLCSENECNANSHNHNHGHFICYSCNQTYCLEEIKSPEITCMKGFYIQVLKLTAEGYCKDCYKN